MISRPTLDEFAADANAYLSGPNVDLEERDGYVLRHNAASPRVIRTLAVPGLCTGVGGMPSAEAARQMRVAYDIVIGGRWREVTHPALAPYALRTA